MGIHWVPIADTVAALDRLTQMPLLQAQYRAPKSALSGHGPVQAPAGDRRPLRTASGQELGGGLCLTNVIAGGLRSVGPAAWHSTAISRRTWRSSDKRV